MTLSILIVNWNSRDFLRRCLLSIRLNCAELDPEIVVVDGGSFDGCAEMLQEEFPDVIFVQSKRNIGFGLANNLGYMHVTGEALLLLNPDTEIQPEAVQQMMAELKRLDAGIVGARLLNSDGTLQQTSIHSLPTPLNQAFGSEFLRRWLPGLSWFGPLAAIHSSEPVPVEAVSGACMLMLSRVFCEVGGFSSQYFMYAEDMDLCLKILKRGRNIYYLPAAEVVHHGGGSSESRVSKFSTVMMREALHSYMRSHHGLFSALAYRTLMGISGVARICFLGAGCLIGNRQARISRCASIRKWSLILSWSLGRERWVKEFCPLECSHQQESALSSASA